MQVDLVKSYQFEAAHTTPWQDDDARLHGHSFRVELVVGGECDPRLGWLVDYAEINDRFEDVYAQLDHQRLNDVPGLESPTLEGLRSWILERMSPKLSGLKDVRVSICGEQIFAPKLLHEDSQLGLPERIRFGFEAAHALPNLPSGHKCHTMHGHSFVVEAAAENAEALTPRLQDVYDGLDHRCLNEISGLENPTSEQLSRWIWNAVADDMSGLDAVVVAETCTARCIYYGR